MAIETVGQLHHALAQFKAGVRKHAPQLADQLMADIARADGWKLIIGLAAATGEDADFEWLDRRRGQVIADVLDPEAVDAMLLPEFGECVAAIMQREKSPIWLLDDPSPAGSRKVARRQKLVEELSDDHKTQGEIVAELISEFPDITIETVKSDRAIIKKRKMGKSKIPPSRRK